MDTPMGNTYEAQRARPAPSSSGAETPSQLLSSTHPRLPPPSTMASLPAIRALPETLAQSSLPTRSPLPLAGTEIRYHPYAASSGSPSSVSGSMAESSEQYATAGISPTQIAAPGLGPQKRAYRQRRKDPSCDACRERKVKCDATDTSACSECLSRSVECRFTKETNRRMSSIKQVQELQSQLDDARRQIDSMRSVIDAGNQEASRPRLPRAEMSSERMPAGYTHSPQAIPGLDEVRQNLQIYSRGVFKVPQPHRQNVSMPAMRRDDPEVPQAEMVEELLKTFHDQMHRQAPMIHWPSFYAQWEKARDANNFAGLSQTWVALFFIVLACGTLQASSSVSPDIEGLRFYVIAARLLNTWTDHLVVDHAKTALLISIYLYEQNVRSASWVWLGTAIRISQEVGLELKEGPWSRTEFEGRVRTYWAIVSWDRLLALQENKTIYMNIAEDDESWPTTVGDHWLHPRGNLPPPENVPGYSTVSIVIPVVRFVGHLTKSLRAKTIAPDVLRRYDEDFRNWNGHLPEPLQLQSESWLEPFAFSAVVPLLMIQFQLYRHNLNLYASIHERHDALKRCHTICRDTVKYLRRTMQDPPANTNRGSVGYRSQTWQQMLDAMAHNLLCRHVWRCTLILCLRGDFMSALTCVEFLKAIGDARKLNIACGRNLAFFLDRLTEKTVRGAAQQDLESDLAMIAYASGDLQGSQNGFVWVGVESQPPQTATASSSSNLRLLLDEETPLSATALLTDKEVNDWGGWSHVEDQIGRLIEEQDRRTHSHYSFRPSASQSPVYHRSTHNETKRVQLAPPSGSPSPGPGTTTGASSTRASTPPTGANRISIAHLI